MRILLLVGIIACYATSFNGGGVNAKGDFASKFFKAVVENQSQNAICSPMSAELILTLMKFGAFGDTQRELESVLQNGYDISNDRTMKFLNDLDTYTQIELQVASNIFVAKGQSLNRHFIKKVTPIFKSSMEIIDFSDPSTASNRINEWSADHTNNRIKNLVEPDNIQPDLQLILANAMYFKGAWRNPFYPNETEPRPFHVNGKTIEQVPTMYKLGVFPNGKLRNLDATFFEMPYKSEDLNHALSMYIIIPNAVDGFVELRKNLDKITIDTLRDNEFDTEVEIFMPKFKIETSLDLTGPLQQLGLNDMFSEYADFRGMMRQKSVKVSKVIQKAFLEVNEEGSEAAVVTETDFMDRMGPPEKRPVFIVDRPFFSIIATETGVTLFSALIVDPLAE